MTGETSGGGGNSVNVPVMGFYQSSAANKSSADEGAASAGRLVVYGDSNCLDSAHSAGKHCFSMMDAILEYSGMGTLPKVSSAHSVIKCLLIA